jgi:murein DD-endopeptidase MepM/ murein hydrolase activator NlpD
MRSVSSESESRPSARRRRRLGLLALATAITATASLGLPPASGRGRLSWLRASFPVAGFAGYTSPFGLRRHPIDGGMRPHQGLDIAAPLGSAVRSWWAGTVADVISDGGCGNGVVIRSGHYEHIYCHLGGRVSGGTYSSGPVRLRRGRRVRGGETIGHVGLSGSTTGPHLHWGVRYAGRWLDPAMVLRAMAESRRAGAPRTARTPNLGSIR